MTDEDGDIIVVEIVSTILLSIPTNHPHHPTLTIILIDYRLNHHSDEDQSSDQGNSTINLVKMFVKLICKRKKKKIDTRGGMIDLPNC